MSFFRNRQSRHRLKSAKIDICRLCYCFSDPQAVFLTTFAARFLMKKRQMDNMERTKELGASDIGSLLWKYAIPSVVTMVVASIYNLVDRIFLGQCVGALAIAGLAITMPVMNIMHAFGSLIGVGSASRMSIVLGKKDERWAEKILGNSLLLTIGLGGTVTLLVYLFMGRILTLFGASAATISYAREYMVIVMPGMWLTTMSFNLTGLMRATGYPHKSMLIMAGGALLNIVLDAVFIYVLNWGIAGAAWATTLSMATSAVFAFLHFVSPKAFIRFKRHGLRPQGYIFRNILLIGMSPFLMNIAASAVVAFLNRQLIRFGGDLAVGAYGIVNTFGTVVVLLMLGVCQGMQPIAGYNYGAGLNERLKEVFSKAMRVNVVCGLVGAALALTIPQILLRAFTTDVELIRIGIPALRYFMVLMPLVGFTITNSIFFQSIDKPWIAITTSLSRQVLILLPMIYIIPTVFESMGHAGLMGLWASATVSDFLGTVLAATLLFSQRKVFQTALKALPDKGGR